MSTYIPKIPREDLVHVDFTDPDPDISQCKQNFKSNNNNLDGRRKLYRSKRQSSNSNQFNIRYKIIKYV